MSSAVVYTRSTPVLSSSRAPLSRATAVHRIEKRHAIQSRSLWWWGRHGAWTSTSEDASDERLHRHQKIMRYKYSRALRRRAMWERENSPPAWSWRGPGRLIGRQWACKPLSTSEHMQAKLKEQESGIPPHDRPFEFHRDFESFKAAVDKALERDTYGVVFGRRLRSAAVSGSSWSPFSRLFGSEDSREVDCSYETTPSRAKKIKIESLDENIPPKTASSESTSQKSVVETQTKKPDDEYVYDPISGRKVLKVDKEVSEALSPKKPFLQTFFAEHNSDDPQDSAVVPAKKSRNDTTSSQKGFENSRSLEYQRLRAAKLGCSIDTTARFGGEFLADPGTSAKEEHIQDQTKRNRDVQNLEHDDDAPPFSGTAYAKESSLPKSREEWLSREGFKQSAISDISPRPMTDHTKERLQPALDRLLPEGYSKRYITKLQPAIDRIESHKPHHSLPPRPAPLNVVTTKLSKENKSQGRTSWEKEADALEKREDLDLLRASDIRAATKTVRTTKQELEKFKTEERRKLEADFATRQKAAEASSDVDSAHHTARASKSVSSIDGVMKHMQRYPDGVVARTMKSIGVFNDAFKKYQNPLGYKADLTEKLELRQEALDKLPSIFKKSDEKPKMAVVPAVSQEVIQIEKAKTDLIEGLKAAKTRVLEIQLKENVQLKELANTINELYQAHTPDEPAMVNDLAVSEDVSPTRDASASGRRTHPLSTASVKPGVIQYPEIKQHIEHFEPRLIELREQAKAIQKGSSAIHTELNMMKSQDNVPEAPEQAELRDIIIPDTSLPEYGGEAAQPRSSDIQQKTATSALNDNLVTQQTANTVKAEETSQQLKASDGVSSTASTVNSPFVILTYNKATADVDLTQVNKLMGSYVETGKVNAITVMGNLNYPAAFVTRFVELEKAGYQLSSGGGDMLIFQKQDTQQLEQGLRSEALETIKLIKSDISELRNKIASEEALNQPATSHTTATSSTKQAATVLDDFPTQIPNPGPAAPIAPPSQHVPNKKKNRSGPKVTRQEQVFSGTIKSNASSSRARDETNSGPTQKRAGFFSRLMTTIRRILLTTVALGGVAYTIGVVTEGLGAHAQQERALTDGNGEAGVGPRKRVVMPATRPGIFSTESTRD